MPHAPVERVDFAGDFAKQGSKTKTMLAAARLVSLASAAVPGAPNIGWAAHLQPKHDATPEPAASQGEPAPMSEPSEPSASASTTSAPAAPAPSSSWTAPSASTTSYMPSIDCVRVITLYDSTSIPVIQKEMEKYGLWDRTVVQTEVEDPHFSRRGVWNAHQRAWKESEGCNNTLVFEDDAFFDDEYAASGMANVERFLAADRASQPYDLIMLGWAYQNCQDEINNTLSNIQRSQSTPRAEPIGDGFTCMYRLKHWSDLHAYVISSRAREEFSKPVWRKQTDQQRDPDHIDNYFALLATLHPSARAPVVVTVRPMIAFQKSHAIVNKWANGAYWKKEQKLSEAWRGNPACMRISEAAIYQLSSDWTSSGGLGTCTVEGSAAYTRHSDYLVTASQSRCDVTKFE